MKELEKLSMSLPHQNSVKKINLVFDQLSEKDVYDLSLKLMKTLDGVKRYALLKVAVKKINRHQLLLGLLSFLVDEKLTSDVGNWLQVISVKLPVHKIVSFVNDIEGNAMLELFVYHLRGRFDAVELNEILDLKH